MEEYRIASFIGDIGFLTDLDGNLLKGIPDVRAKSRAPRDTVECSFEKYIKYVSRVEGIYYSAPVERGNLVIITYSPPAPHSKVTLLFQKFRYLRISWLWTACHFSQP